MCVVKLVAVLAGAALGAVQARELRAATAGPAEEVVVGRALDVVEDGLALAQGDAPLQPLVALASAEEEASGEQDLEQELEEEEVGDEEEELEEEKELELDEEKGRNLKAPALPKTSWTLNNFTVNLQRVANGGVTVTAQVAKPMTPGWIAVGLGSAMSNLPMVVGFVGAGPAGGVQTYKTSSQGKPGAGSCTGTTDVKAKSIKKVGNKYVLKFTAKNLCGSSLAVSPLTLAVARGTGSAFSTMAQHDKWAWKGVLLNVP